MFGKSLAVYQLLRSRAENSILPCLQIIVDTDGRENPVNSDQGVKI